MVLFCARDGLSVLFCPSLCSCSTSLSLQTKQFHPNQNSLGLQDKSRKLSEKGTCRAFCIRLIQGIELIAFLSLWFCSEKQFWLIAQRPSQILRKFWPSAKWDCSSGVTCSFEAKIGKYKSSQETWNPLLKSVSFHQEISFWEQWKLKICYWYFYHFLF